MADEFQLPVEIIQQIQHHLDGKQAAQTVVLSKSWYEAWSTRPTLYFNEGCFGLSRDFIKFARETIKRYKDSKLYVNELVLIMSSIVINRDESKICTDRLIRDALNLCGKEHVLTIKYKGHGSNSEYFFSAVHPFHPYVSLAQLFASASLTGLHVSRWRIDNGRGRALFPRLKSLWLDDVYITNNGLRDLLSGCPLIEDLLLESCSWLRTVDVSKMRKLVKLSISCLIEVEFEDPEAELRYLRILQLERVRLSTEFFTRFSSRFPLLVKLSLEFVTCQDLEISSRSLRYLSVRNCEETRKMRFDVPNIVKFVFKGDYGIPFVSFDGTVPMECVSDVQFALGRSVMYFWFVDLRKFLLELRPSRISLHIKLNGQCNVLPAKIPRCFYTPAVENLSMYASEASHASPSMWHCLFSNCHPRFITEYKPAVRRGKGHDLYILHDLYELLKGNDLFYHKYNLEDVNLELFEEDLMEWQTVPLERLNDLIKGPKNYNIRFRFRYRAGLVFHGDSTN